MNNISEARNDFDVAVWVHFLANARDEEPAWVQTAFTITIYIILLMGLAGNLLTCTVIYSDKTMHTATNYYLFNLAVSDIIVIFFFLPATFDYSDYNNPWTCKVQIYFVLVLWNNSVLTITILAIERYVAIWHPLKRQTSSVWRRVCKVITCVWLFAILETLPELWTVDAVKVNHYMICSAIPTPMARVTYGLLALTTFVVPMSIIMFVYVMIAFKVNATQQYYNGSRVFNYRDNRTKVNKLVENTHTVVVQKSSYNKIGTKIMKKIIYLLVALTLAFLVCWLPFFIIRVMYFALETNQLMALVKWWSIGQRFVIINSLFSVVLNPILFSIISTKFRESLARLWITKIRRNV